jgi:hypothetical protein
VFFVYRPNRELHSRSIDIVKDRHPLLVIVTAALFFTKTLTAAPEWEAIVTKDPPGNFPAPRPLRASYHFGWSGITAATGDVHFSRPDKRFQLEATGKTIGFVRALWKMDVTYRGFADSETLRPIESKQTETYRKKKFVTELAFTNAGVSRTRTEGIGATKTSTVPFNFPGLHDLHSALLYLRSQPLADHSVYRVVVYPTTSAYLATVKVSGREHVSVRAGSYNAIKIDIDLKHVGKKFQLEPHKKFRRATIWISDDENRIPLRVEAQIFVGTVFAELQTLRFDQEKSGN